MKHLELGIEGMSCAACSSRLERALGKLPGVSEAGVNLATRRASLTYDEGETGPERIIEAVTETGFTAVTAGYEVGVGGMSCASCSARLERGLTKTAGVLQASVNLATQRATLRYIPAVLGPEEIRRVIEETGYEPRPETEGAEDAEEREEAARRSALGAMRRDLVLAAALSLPVLFLSMGPTFVPALDRALGALAPAWVWRWSEALLTTLVLFGPGRRFFRPGWAALRHLAPDMNTLVMIGTGAAWLFSFLVLLFPDLFPAQARNLYFDSAGRHRHRHPLRQVPRGARQGADLGRYPQARRPAGQNRPGPARRPGDGRAHRPGHSGRPGGCAPRGAPACRRRGPPGREPRG